MRSLFPDFEDFLMILNQLEVRYMVIGGWALGWHGWPRLTKDLDIWVAVDPENAHRIREALSMFSAPGPIAEDFFDDSVKNVYFMGVSPTKIEIISAIDGRTFDDCFLRAKTIRAGELDVRIISLEDFKINKRASGRLRDLADLEDLGEEV